MELRGSLSQDELASFLENVTIPIRIGCRTPSGGLWMLSMWYQYRSGETDDEWRLECATAADADVVTFLSENPGVAFEVSTNEPPYTGVRGRGTASIDPDPDKETLRALLERYLDGTESPLAHNLLREGRDEVRITVEPDVVSGWDYTERMGEADGE